MFAMDVKTQKTGFKIACLSFLLFMFVNTNMAADVFMLNFGDIKTKTREMINDNKPSEDLWHHSQVKISSYINIAQQQIANSVWCIEKTTDFAIVSGQREYSLSDDFITSLRVTANGTLLPATSISELDKTSSWETDTSSAAPSYYFVNHTTYSYFGFDVIPDTFTYTQITMKYVAVPEMLNDDDDIPFNGIKRLYPYHFLIPLWASAMLSFQDNDNEKFTNYYALYQDGIKNMERTIRIDGDYTPSFNAIR